MKASNCLPPSFQFAVNYKCRHNSESKRDDVIQLLAGMVTRNGDYSHRVDLNQPELTVMVEIIKVTGYMLNRLSMTYIAMEGGGRDSSSQ